MWRFGVKRLVIRSGESNCSVARSRDEGDDDD